MDQIFVFCMLTTVCVSIFTLFLIPFFTFSVFILMCLKYLYRSYLIYKDDKLFSGIDVITDEMRLEMINVMEDRAEKNLKHLRNYRKKTRIERENIKKGILSNEKSRG